MTNPVSQEEALEALRDLSVQVCAEWTGPEETHPENILRSFITQSGWRPIETCPTAESEPFMILLPKNDVADFVQLQVTIFEGQMYPDALSGMIDWWSWVGPEQATHWRPCFDAPPLRKAPKMTSDKQPDTVTVRRADVEAVVAGISDNPAFPKAIELRERFQAALSEISLTANSESGAVSEPSLQKMQTSPALQSTDAKSGGEAKYTQAEFDEVYEIGKSDGISEATQHIDTLTGGDGEYRYCLGMEDDDRHTPDPAAMQKRIVERFEALSALPTKAEVGVDGLQQAINETLRSHRLFHTVSSDGEHDYVLTDRLTPDGESSIKLGIEEIDHLAECVADTVAQWLSGAK